MCECDSLSHLSCDPRSRDLAIPWVLGRTGSRGSGSASSMTSETSMITCLDAQPTSSNHSLMLAIPRRGRFQRPQTGRRYCPITAISEKSRNGRVSTSSYLHRERGGLISSRGDLRGCHTVVSWTTLESESESEIQSEGPDLRQTARESYNLRIHHMSAGPSTRQSILWLDPITARREF